MSLLNTPDAGVGAVIVEYESPSSPSFAHAEIATLVRAHGHVVMRPHKPLDPPPYGEILACLALDHIEDYSSGSVVRRVVSSPFLATDQVAPEITVPPHNEMAYSPSPPDLLCFVCVSPPDTGGETTIFDGEVALRVMDSALAERLAEHAIVWTRELGAKGPPNRWWSRALGVSSFADCRARAEALGYRVVELDERAETLRIELANGQIRHGRALVTSIVDQHPLTYAIDYAGTFDETHCAVRWDDGAPITRDELSALRSALEAGRRHFRWTRSGEFVVLDNHRFAHGRQPFTGPRTIAVALGMASWLRA